MEIHKFWIDITNGWLITNGYDTRTNLLDVVTSISNKVIVLIGNPVDFQTEKMIAKSARPFELSTLSDNYLRLIFDFWR